MYADLDDRKKYFAHEKMPEYIYILPINFDYVKGANVIFNLDKEKERQKLISIFRTNIKGVKVLSFDNMPLFKDGIHLNYEGHELLANSLEEVLNHEWKI